MLHGMNPCPVFPPWPPAFCGILIQLPFISSSARLILKIYRIFVSTCLALCQFRVLKIYSVVALTQISRYATNADWKINQQNKINCNRRRPNLHTLLLRTVLPGHIAQSSPWFFIHPTVRCLKGTATSPARKRISRRGVFPGGHPSKDSPHPTGLNFGGVSVWMGDQ